MNKQSRTNNEAMQRAGDAGATDIEELGAMQKEKQSFSSNSKLAIVKVIGAPVSIAAAARTGRIVRCDAPHAHKPAPSKPKRLRPIRMAWIIPVSGQRRRAKLVHRSK
jgi:hypothetical protein